MLLCCILDLALGTRGKGARCGIRGGRGSDKNSRKSQKKHDEDGELVQICRVVLCIASGFLRRPSSSCSERSLGMGCQRGAKEQSMRSFTIALAKGRRGERLHANYNLKSSVLGRRLLSNPGIRDGGGIWMRGGRRAGLGGPRKEGGSASKDGGTKGWRDGGRRCLAVVPEGDLAHLSLSLSRVLCFPERDCGMCLFRSYIAFSLSNISLLSLYPPTTCLTSPPTTATGCAPAACPRPQFPPDLQAPCTA